MITPDQVSALLPRSTANGVATATTVALLLALSGWVMYFILKQARDEGRSRTGGLLRAITIMIPCLAVIALVPLSQRMSAQATHLWCERIAVLLNDPTIEIRDSGDGETTFLIRRIPRSTVTSGGTTVDVMRDSLGIPTDMARRLVIPTTSVTPSPATSTPVRVTSRGGTVRAKAAVPAYTNYQELW